MPILDFTEIPAGNSSGDEQDTFELFARDFLRVLGYEILVDPARGADGGRDLVVGERIQGTVTTSTKKWLVSCKHNAHSGSAVSKSVEADIRDRLDRHNCQAFMAFYSTVPTASLSEYFESLKTSVDVHCYDKEKIEVEVVNNPDLREQVVKRYMPLSFQKLIVLPSAPVRVGTDVEPLQCCKCGRDLLEDVNGVFCVIERCDRESSGLTIVDVYWSCYGDCDDTLRRTKIPAGCVDLWESIADLSLPICYLQFVLRWLQRTSVGTDQFTPDAAMRFGEFVAKMSQTVMRETTSEQMKRVHELAKFDLL